MYMYIYIRYTNTESENRLQLDSVWTSINVNRLSLPTADVLPTAVGNDSRPWVVPRSIKWLSTIMRERRIPPDPESDGFPHLFRTFLSPHIGNAWRARHGNNNNNNNWHIYYNLRVRLRERVKKISVASCLYLTGVTEFDYQYYTTCLTLSWTECTGNFVVWELTPLTSDLCMRHVVIRAADFND